MEQLKALHESVGDGIAEILSPTFKITIPLLLKNKESIYSICPRTEQYGTHSRQKLDIYSSPESDGTGPVLIFLYGGGLTRGDRILHGVPEGLIYRNVGTFFAKRGIETIIPDYRRVNSEDGGEDAVFPNGGDDLSAVLVFVEALNKSCKRDVFLMGNSAGGVHLSTYMLSPKFSSQREALVSGTESITLKGSIALSVPLHFDTAHPARMGMLASYFGTPLQVKERQPYGLLQAAIKKGTRKENFVPVTLALVGEWDPVEDISQPMSDFVTLWQGVWDGLELREVRGHNHISPPLVLMSGEGEEWGEEVVAWIRGLLS